LHLATPKTHAAEVLAAEIDFAARMAVQSCKYMLWQQALAADQPGKVRILAKRARAELFQLNEEFDTYWPTRNKGTTATCSKFLQWRMEDYRRGVLHFPPEIAAVERRSTSGD
jgi:hypothetical protein